MNVCLLLLSVSVVMNNHCISVMFWLQLEKYVIQVQIHVIHRDSGKGAAATNTQAYLSNFFVTVFSQCQFVDHLS